MKIRLKGFRSLIKAVQNRAHLFPVKKLINGKTKTFYATRYVSGGEAMDIAKQGYKINSYQEAIFESKDGKKKNISEKEVLEMYDAAGKPGILQEFIKQNFKRPKVKANTKDNGQLSFDNMMNQSTGEENTSKNKPESSEKEKTEKLWQEFEKWRVKADNNLSGIVNSYHKKVEDMTPSEYRRIMEHFFKEEIARGYTQSGETLDECLENYIQMFKDDIKDKEDRKNAWNDDYYKEIYNHLDEMYKKGSRLFKYDAKKYIRQFIWDKEGLDRSAAENAGKAALKDILVKNGEYKEKEEKKEPDSGITITGPIYDDDERPTYYINDNGNVIETQDTKIVDQYRAKQKQQEETQGQESQNDTNNNKQIIIDKLQQKGATIWEKNGHRRLYFNEAGKEVADRIAKEEDISEKSFAYECLEYFTSKTYLNLRDDKLYFPSNGSNGYNLDSNYFEKFIQYTKEMHNNIDTTSNDNVKLLNVEGEKELLRAIDGEVSRGNPYKVYFKPKKMLRLVGLEDNTLDGEVLTNGQIGRMISDLGSATINLITGKVTTKSYDRENIIPKVQETINKLISEIKAETQGSEPDLNALAEQNQALEDKRAKQRLREYSKEYVEEYKERNTLDDLNARDRFGTKKIESKGEYKQVSNINELIDKARAIKDYHVDIKGRAILDMLGVNIPMYAKRNGKLFAGKNLGYCRAIVNEETGQVMPYEIGIVAETSNKTRETGTVIHEAMHAKIKGISDNMLNKCAMKGGLSEAEVQHNVEESLVEMAGFSLAKTIHAGDSYRGYMTYPAEISLTLPRIWDIEEFKEARKKGIDGIGKEIYNQIMAGNREFIDKIVNTYVSDEAKEKASKRTAAIEKTMLDRTDKLETITGGNEKSPIGNLVEELKRGTISLEVALNSSKYGAIAAVLITKFLEDEDLDGIDALIGSL